MEQTQIDPTLSEWELGTLRFSTAMFGNPRLNPRPDLVTAIHARIAGDRSDTIHALLREVEAYYRMNRNWNLASHIKSAIESPH